MEKFVQDLVLLLSVLFLVVDCFDTQPLVSEWITSTECMTESIQTTKRDIESTQLSSQCVASTSSCVYAFDEGDTIWFGLNVQNSQSVRIFFRFKDMISDIDWGVINEIKWIKDEKGVLSLSFVTKGPLSMLKFLHGKKTGDKPINLPKWSFRASTIGKEKCVSISSFPDICWTTVGEKNGQSTSIMVTNTGYIEISLEIDFTELTNSRVSMSSKEINTKNPVRLEIARRLPGNDALTTEVATVLAMDQSKWWSYTWKTKAAIGSLNARHNDSVLYDMPFSGTHVCTQAYDEPFSHHHSKKYALDFDLNDGDAVFSARPGIVVMTRSDQTKSKFDKGVCSRPVLPSCHTQGSEANAIYIRHDDGTFAIYAHLRPHGVHVRAGMVLTRRTRIGKAGMTGYATGPHLHFEISHTTSFGENDEGSTTMSLPVKFRPDGFTPKKLGSYTYGIDTTKCGNHIRDGNEECDGYIGGCDGSTCHCKYGFKPYPTTEKDPKKNVKCINVCGNKEFDAQYLEECEVSLDGASATGCTDECHCSVGKVPDPLRGGYCKNSCGDKLWEEIKGEECDGSEHCTDKCICEDGYKPKGDGECKKKGILSKIGKLWPFKKKRN